MPSNHDASYAVGESFTQTQTFSPDAIKHFALLVGDHNPLHHDDEFAASTRFGGLIVSATQYTAIMMAMVGTYLTERNAGLGLGFNFTYRKAVLADDPVTMEWVITAVEAKPKLQGDLITLEGALRNSAGEVCVTATSSSLSLPVESLKLNPAAAR